MVPDKLVQFVQNLAADYRCCNECSGETPVAERNKADVDGTSVAAAKKNINRNVTFIDRVHKTL